MFDLYQAALMFNANPGHLRRRPDPFGLAAEAQQPRAAGGSRLARRLRLRAEKLRAPGA